MKTASNMDCGACMVMQWFLMKMQDIYVPYMKIFGYVKQNCEPGRAITQVPPKGAQPFESADDNNIISS